jgi:hypothetical protein
VSEKVSRCTIAKSGRCWEATWPLAVATCIGVDWHGHCLAEEGSSRPPKQPICSPWNKTIIDLSDDTHTSKSARQEMEELTKKPQPILHSLGSAWELAVVSFWSFMVVLLLREARGLVLFGCRGIL